MRVRHYARGKFYTIECPRGTSVVRRRDQPAGGEVGHDLLVVPREGTEIRIPTDPPELLPLLAETGHFGVALVGEPEPVMAMTGVVCPECGQDDVTLLQLRDDSEVVRCDDCGADFDVPMPPDVRAPIARRADG